jgi:hypothetical protein
MPDAHIQYGKMREFPLKLGIVPLRSSGTEIPVLGRSLSKTPFLSEVVHGTVGTITHFHSFVLLTWTMNQRFEAYTVSVIRSRRSGHGHVLAARLYFQFIAGLRNGDCDITCLQNYPEKASLSETVPMIVQFHHHGLQDPWKSPCSTYKVSWCLVKAKGHEICVDRPSTHGAL